MVALLKSGNEGRGGLIMIEAKIIADSISPSRVRLTTFALRYPRFIHAELMTHRVFSRNASSSRAIPVHKILQQIQEDPVLPVYWGKNQRGMQADEELDASSQDIAKACWLAGRDKVVEIVEDLVKLGVHKQIANRMLEPWSHISVVVTATEYANWFNLRCHPDAQPEIKALADQMRDLYFSHEPADIRYGYWHLPFIQEKEQVHLRGDTTALIQASVARCARVSYLTHDKKEPDMEADISLHDRLFESHHLSPFEHVATPISSSSTFSGNFRGWTQYRKTIAGENQTTYVPPQENKDV